MATLSLPLTLTRPKTEEITRWHFKLKAFWKKQICTKATVKSGFVQDCVNLNTLSDFKLCLKFNTQTWVIDLYVFNKYFSYFSKCQILPLNQTHRRSVNCTSFFSWAWVHCVILFYSQLLCCWSDFVTCPEGGGGTGVMRNRGWWYVPVDSQTWNNE